MDVAGDDGLAGSNGMKLLFPRDMEQLSNGYHARMRTRRLLAAYISKAEGVNRSEARYAVVEQDIWCYGRVRIPVRDGWQVVGACSARRHRRKMLRSDWYIAAELCTDHDEHRQVYYGKVLRFLRYTFHVNGSALTKDLILTEWANGLFINQFDQVYKPSAGNGVFRNSSVEDVTVILHSMGVLERRTVRTTGKHTFFLDPSRAANGFLDETATGSDGINRTLLASRR